MQIATGGVDKTVKIFDLASATVCVPFLMYPPRLHFSVCSVSVVSTRESFSSVGAVFSASLADH